jgi:hypothetical protein
VLILDQQLPLVVSAVLAQTNSTCHSFTFYLSVRFDNDPGPVPHLNSTISWHLEASLDPRVARAPSNFDKDVPRDSAANFGRPT